MIRIYAKPYSFSFRGVEEKKKKIYRAQSRGAHLFITVLAKRIYIEEKKSVMKRNAERVNAGVKKVSVGRDNNPITNKFPICNTQPA
jgi:hypothetical protein